MNQAAVVAIEKGVKARVTSEGGKLHRSAQTPALYSGHSRQWKALDDDGEQFPNESKRVQLRIENVLTQFRSLMTELFDITLTKDSGNALAVADIVVGETTIATAVPATSLIFLEKQLEHVRTFFEKLPTLDESEEWSRDEVTGLYRTEESLTHKTKKVQKPIVLYQATEHHPAQTQLISEDVTIGHWRMTKFSGAFPEPVQKELLNRLTTLQKAVKAARVRANTTVVQRKNIGESMFKYLLG